jgi:hypothetical protein
MLAFSGFQPAPFSFSFDLERLWENFTLTGTSYNFYFVGEDSSLDLSENCLGREIEKWGYCCSTFLTLRLFERE